MKTKFVWVVLVALPAVVMAQKPKSKKEQDAVLAVQNAQAPDDRIAAVEALIQKFADTEFKSWALNRAAEAAEQKRDSAKAQFYAEQALAADAKDYEAMLLLSAEIATHTREFDLDKDEKLTKADKYAKDALVLIPTAVKPNPQVTDAQWDAFKKDKMALAHESMGTAAMVRKKYDSAIQEYKTAVETAADQEPATYVRLANAYNEAGKSDDAIAAIDKVLAMPDLNPQVKQVAQSEKARAEKAKAAKK
jgi:tetratricopeptide (TPR) repeat protein